MPISATGALDTHSDPRREMPAVQGSRPADTGPVADQQFLREGALWAAQVASVRPGAFALVVGGMSFDIDGTPPAAEQDTLLVRVAEAGAHPVFEVVTSQADAVPAPLALQLLIAAMLRRSDRAPRPEMPANPRDSGSTLPIPAEVDQPPATRPASPASVRSIAHYVEGGPTLEVQVTRGATEDVWHVEIERDDVPSRTGDRRRSATVMFFAELADSGPIEVHARLCAGQLHVSFIVCRDEVHAAIVAGLPDLRRALHAAGLRVDGIDARVNAAHLALTAGRRQQQGRVAAAHGGLLDVRV